MSEIRKQDYYIGAVINILLSKNHDSKPSLMECEEAPFAKTYKMITDTSNEFNLYIKYTSACVKGTENVWSISFTETDKDRIDACFQSGQKTFVILCCGNEPRKNGEIVVLTHDEYSSMAHKTGIRVIVPGKGAKKYLIVDKQARKTFSVDRNRIETKITDIMSSLK